MSMEESPGSAYVLEARKIIPHLAEEYRAGAEELIEEQDTSGLQDFLCKPEVWPEDFPPIASVYRPGDEDTVDGVNMVTGEVYLLFEQEDLYILRPKPITNRMEVMGIKPELSNFSVWG